MGSAAAQLTTPCDVLIIGAGMAGSCLARQLRLQQPDLRIVNIDRKTHFDYWVGESTVEAWEDYMTRVLKLGPFLKKNFILKHGLRMFFDSENRDLPLAEMSEFGRSRRHPFPARQVDRSVFDREMCAMNRALGVEVVLGAEVLPGKEGITLDPRGGHIVRTKDRSFRCRWLVDAAGYSSPLASKLGLVPRETRNPSASYWGRFADFRGLDALGGAAWRSRVRNTRRYHSTCHFMYRGYWIWHIALSDDVLSLGVEFNKEKTPLRIANGEDLVAFLRRHRCLDEILGPRARLLDFGGLVHLPRCASTHFSRDRWFLAGMSGLFVDVMGSGTSRLYSETNRLIGELIKADREGRAGVLESRLKHFNLHARASYETHLRNLSRYDWYGSFDVWSNFFGAGLARYFNSILPNAISDLKTVVETADRHAAGCECGFDMRKGAAAAIYRKTEEFVRFLDRKGSYYAANRGRFADSSFWEERPGALDKLRRPRNLAVERSEERVIVRDLADRYARRRAEIEAESLKAPSRALDKFGWTGFAASTEIEPGAFDGFLKELQAERCVHSWRWLKPGREGWLSAARASEEKLRPTVLYGYYGLKPDGSRELAGVASVSDRVNRAFALEGFPVVARCYIRRRFRGFGLYPVILDHRIAVCRKRWGRRLRGIHLGTSDPRVEAVLKKRARFVRLGSELLGVNGERHEVQDYLYLAPGRAPAKRELASFCAAVPVAKVADEFRH